MAETIFGTIDPNAPTPVPAEPVYDHTGLIERHAAERQYLASPVPAWSKDDRTDLRNHPEKVAERLAQMDALERRAGIVPKPPVDPATAEFEARWPLTIANDWQADEVAKQLAAEKALVPAARQANVLKLIKEMGQAAYDVLVADARSSLAPGATLPDELKSNKFALTVTASKGRYLTQRAKAQAALKVR